MQLAPHHKQGLAGAAVLSSIALFDAMTHGLTGHGSVFADGSTMPWLLAAGDIAHGAAYLSLLLVLRAERTRLAVNRPDYYRRLQPGATEGALDAFESRFSLRLPEPFQRDRLLEAVIDFLPVFAVADE